MTDRNFKPDSGTDLVFEDAGSTDRLRITDGGSTILYEDGGAAALTIDTSGKVGIGNTNPGDYNSSMNDLVVGNLTGDHGITVATATNATGYLGFADGSTTAADEYRGLIEYDHGADVMKLRTDAVIRLTIDSSGNFTGSASADISDQRLKENITDLTNSLGKISQLRGVSYTWKKEANKDLNVPYYGLLAQELEAIIPELVWNHSIHDTEEIKYKSIHMTGLIPVLVEAVKELSAKVTALENA